MKWIDRRFDFQFPVAESSRLLERLRNAPDELDALLSTLPRETLVARDGDTWSIQENAGHLASAESLFLGRLDDYAAGLETLRPADMSNQKTTAARHNESDIGSILAVFRQKRNELVRRLEALEPGGFGKSAMHPRLGQPMRICDMMYFQAEHDSHHLARIKELIERFGGLADPESNPPKETE
jgi:uncharacterized damage-inducible protein DinB